MLSCRSLRSTKHSQVNSCLSKPTYNLAVSVRSSLKFLVLGPPLKAFVYLYLNKLESPQCRQVVKSSRLVLSITRLQQQNDATTNSQWVSDIWSREREREREIVLDSQFACDKLR